MKAALALALVLLLPGVARAGVEDDALEYLYEAAGALDKAEVAKQEGRADLASELILQAKDDLGRAEALAPNLPRVAFERARLHLLAGATAVGEAALAETLRGNLEIADRVRGVELLDQLRQAQGRPGVAEEWKRASGMRDAGAMMVGVGVATFFAGVAVAFDSYARGAASKVTEDAIAINRFGWALAGVGGGVALGGTGLTVVGSVRLAGLQPVLPGPWHLPGGPAEGGSVTLRGPLPDPTAPLALRSPR